MIRPTNSDTRSSLTLQRSSPAIRVGTVSDQGEAVGDRLELVRRGQPFVAEPLGEQPLDSGYEGGSAGQEHLFHLVRGDAGLAQHLVDGGAEPDDIVGNPG